MPGDDQEIAGQLGKDRQQERDGVGVDDHQVDEGHRQQQDAVLEARHQDQRDDEGERQRRRQARPPQDDQPDEIEQAPGENEDGLAAAIRPRSSAIRPSAARCRSAIAAIGAEAAENTTSHAGRRRRARGKPSNDMPHTTAAPRDNRRLCERRGPWLSSFCSNSDMTRAARPAQARACKYILSQGRSAASHEARRGYAAA